VARLDGIGSGDGEFCIVYSSTYVRHPRFPSLSPFVPRSRSAFSHDTLSLISLATPTLPFELTCL
jgi:hypothetical protein